MLPRKPRPSNSFEPDGRSHSVLFNFNGSIKPRLLWDAATKTFPVELVSTSGCLLVDVLSGIPSALKVECVVRNFYDVEFNVCWSVVVCGLTFSVAAFLTVFNAGFCRHAAARVSSAS